MRCSPGSLGAWCGAPGRSFRRSGECRGRCTSCPLRQGCLSRKVYSCGAGAEWPPCSGSGCDAVRQGRRPRARLSRVASVFPKLRQLPKAESADQPFCRHRRRQGRTRCPPPSYRNALARGEQQTVSVRTQARPACQYRFLRISFHAAGGYERKLAILLDRLALTRFLLEPPRVPRDSSPKPIHSMLP
jgi:hypothetical protein